MIYIEQAPNLWTGTHSEQLPAADFMTPLLQLLLPQAQTEEAIKPGANTAIC